MLTTDHPELAMFSVCYFITERHHHFEWPSFKVKVRVRVCVLWGSTQPSIESRTLATNTVV